MSARPLLGVVTITENQSQAFVLGQPTFNVALTSIVIIMLGIVTFLLMAVLGLGTCRSTNLGVSAVKN